MTFIDVASVVTACLSCEFVSNHLKCLMTDAIINVEKKPLKLLIGCVVAENTQDTTH